MAAVCQVSAAKIGTSVLARMMAVTATAPDHPQPGTRERTDGRDRDRLDQELQHHISISCADRLADADLPRAFQHRRQQHVGDPDSANQQRDGRERPHQHLQDEKASGNLIQPPRSCGFDRHLSLPVRPVAATAVSIVCFTPRDVLDTADADDQRPGRAPTARAPSPGRHRRTEQLRAAPARQEMVSAARRWCAAS